MSKLFDLDELRKLCEEANAPERGRLLDYCASHDYGDPGYPPEECSACEFERDRARSRLAHKAAEVMPALLAEVERLRSIMEKTHGCLERAIRQDGSSKDVFIVSVLENVLGVPHWWGNWTDYLEQVRKTAGRGVPRAVLTLLKRIVNDARSLDSWVAASSGKVQEPEREEVQENG